MKAWALGLAATVAAAALWQLWRRRDQPLHEPQQWPGLLVAATPAVQLVVPQGVLSGRYAVSRTATHTHRGIDIAAPEGSAVHSPQDGVVVGSWPDCERSGYGNNVLVEHPSRIQVPVAQGGVYTFYAHLQRSVVSAGDVVRAGDVIGFVGSTRCGIDRAHMAPHLHFETHTSLVGSRRRPVINEHNPARIDPERYLEQLWPDDAAAQA